MGKTLNKVSFCFIAGAFPAVIGAVCRNLYRIAAKMKPVGLLGIHVFIAASCQHSTEKPRNQWEETLDSVGYLMENHQMESARKKLDEALEIMPQDVHDPLENVDQYLNFSRARLYAIQLADSTYPLSFPDEIPRTQEQIDQIHELQHGLVSIQASRIPLTLQQQITIHLTLASLYCLVPDTIFLADRSLDCAIGCLEKQLNGLFERRNTYDPKILPIQQLKKKIRSLRLVKTEVNLRQKKWTEALRCLHTYSADLDPGGLSKRIERLEARSQQIAPFLSSPTQQGQSGKSVYDYEWSRVQTELIELKKTLRYQEECLKATSIPETPQCP